MSFSSEVFVIIGRLAPKFSAVMLAITAAIISSAVYQIQYEKSMLIGLGFSDEKITIETKVDFNEKANKIDYLLARVKEIEGSVNLYSAELAAIKTSTIDKAVVVSKFYPVVNEFQSIKDELRDLKKLILNNPETSLSLSKIQQQIEFLQKSDEKIYNDISAYSSVGMWLLGALITISLALFGVVISVVSRSKT